MKPLFLAVATLVLGAGIGAGMIPPAYACTDGAAATN